MTNKKYICGIDYQHEMELGLADFYDSIDELKREKACWEECGIMEILLDSSGKELKASWIYPQRLRFGRD